MRLMMGWKSTSVCNPAKESEKVAEEVVLSTVYRPLDAAILSCFEISAICWSIGTMYRRRRTLLSPNDAQEVRSDVQWLSTTQDGVPRYVSKTFLDRSLNLTRTLNFTPLRWSPLDLVLSPSGIGTKINKAPDSFIPPSSHSLVFIPRPLEHGPKLGPKSSSPHIRGL
jgi:hypothetical protein